MKIYCILCDAADLNQNLKRTLVSKGFSIYNFITHCFTTTTIVAMMTGKLPSELENGGIGYILPEKYKINGKINWPWKHQLLFYKLKKAGWELHTHNGHSWFEIIFNVDEISETSSAVPNVHNLVKNLTWDDNLIGRECLLSDKYMQNEKKFINLIQSEKPENKFYFIIYLQFHAAILRNYSLKAAEKRLIEILNMWNFDEENSMFFIFSDHSNWKKFSNLCEPISYFMWLAFKNNTNFSFDFAAKTIECRQFYPTIMNILNMNCNVDVPAFNEKPNDIFFLEDARMAEQTSHSLAAVALKIKDNILYQTTYYKQNFHSFIMNIENRKYYKTETIIELAEALKNKFNWIKI